jgi:glycogen synthase kinase 3 beta
VPSFYSRGEKDDVYLNLVMEFIPETIHRTLRNHTKANKLVPALSTKLYMYQYVETSTHTLSDAHVKARVSR